MSTITVHYKRTPTSPAVVLEIDGSKHPWWEICDRVIAPRFIPGFDRNAPDPVFDRVMKKMTAAARKRNHEDKSQKHGPVASQA